MGKSSLVAGSSAKPVNQSASGMAIPPELMAYLETRFGKVENLLTELVQQRTVKDWYSTDEVAKIEGKAEFTVREWCRNGRVNAEKKGSGRGKYQAWLISNEELLRIQREGLLPNRKS